MGNVVKEFLCPGHGRFDSTEPVCPRGCTAVERVFITPVGIQSARTRSVDATLDAIAGDYKLSNMNTRRDAHAARITDPKVKKAQEQQEAIRKHLHKKFAGLNLVNTKAGTGGWGGVTKGGTYETGGNIRDADRGPGAPATLAATGTPAENVLGEVSEALVKPRTIPIADPQKLTIKDAKVA